VRGINDHERMTLMGTMNRLLPMVRGDRKGYYAQFAFPVENTNEALEYMTGGQAFGARATCHCSTQKEMLSFT